MALWMDLKYAIRLLYRSPVFTLLTIIVMAIGIGISLYIHTVLYVMTFKPLPFVDSKNVVAIDRYANNVYYTGGNININDALLLKKSNHSLRETGLYKEDYVSIDGRRYPSANVESNMFDFVRTPPFLGRPLTHDDQEIGAEPVTVISFKFWQNHFASRKDILNQIIVINGKQTRIVGVMPNNFAFPRFAEIWQPLIFTNHSLNRSESMSVAMYARLAPNVSYEAAETDLRGIMQTLSYNYPDTNAGVSVYVSSFMKKEMGKETYTFLLAIYSAVLFILALACINVGNLLIARTISRSREMAIRMTLGAPFWRLISQILWESIIICFTYSCKIIFFHYISNRFFNNSIKI